VRQLEASVKVAQAGIEQAKANVAQSKASLDVALSIDKLNPAAIAKLKLDEARNKYSAAEAGLTGAKAVLDQAQTVVVAAQDSVNGLQSQVQSADFNLQQCTVRAPADGFVTNWQIRPGTFVTSIPLAAAGTFIDTSQTVIVASYPANQLMHVKPGQPVEMVFESRPGQLFLGTVDSIIEATGEGQFEAGGKLPSASAIGSPGFLAVRFTMDNPAEADALPMGTPGAVAIYTDHGKPFAMISKVTIRMKKWLYFLPLP
jgi:multidrug resistance efflux pump